MHALKSTSIKKKNNMHEMYAPDNVEFELFLSRIKEKFLLIS